MTHAAYFATIAFSAIGVLLAARRFTPGAVGRRVAVAMAVTVPVFLALDAAGALRGWFRSDPRLSLAILPGGIPFEEPFLLTFLVLLSVVLWRAAARLAGED